MTPSAPLFRFMWLFLAGCSLSHASDGTLDVLARPDARAEDPDAAAPRVDASALPDAHVMPFDARVAVDARREDAASPSSGCFAADMVVATTTSGPSFDGIIALEDGWLISYGGLRGDMVARLGPEGHVIGTASGSLPNGHLPHDRSLATGGWIRIGSSIITVGSGVIQRFDVAADEVLPYAYPPYDPGPANVLTVARQPSGGPRMIRTVWYEADEEASEPRLHVTDIELDEIAPSGFSMHDGVLGRGLIAELGPAFRDIRYDVRDTPHGVPGNMMRTIEPGRSMLIQIGALRNEIEGGTGYRVWERVTWEAAPDDFVYGTLRLGIASLGVWGTGMVVARSEPSSGTVFDARIEPLPEDGSWDRIALGPGKPMLFDDTVAMINQGTVRFWSYAGSDGSELTVVGDIRGIARRGDDVAVISQSTDPRGEAQLRMRCVRLSPSS